MNNTWIIALLGLLLILCEIANAINPFANFAEGSFINRLSTGLSYSVYHYSLLAYGILRMLIDNNITAGRFINISFLLIFLVGAFSGYIIPLNRIMGNLIKAFLYRNLPPLIELIINLIYAAVLYFAYGVAITYTILGIKEKTKEIHTYHLE